MDDTLKMVEQFHQAFDIKVEPTPVKSSPRPVVVQEYLQHFASEMARLGAELLTAAEQCSGGGSNTELLRLQLCQEELGELAEALAKEDMVSALDALCDMRYVADGTTLSLGLQGVFMPAFKEVQRSNMSKLDAQGKPVKNKAGRVVKGVRYSKPDLKVFFEPSTCAKCGETHDTAHTNHVQTSKGIRDSYGCFKCSHEWSMEWSMDRVEGVPV